MDILTAAQVVAEWPAEFAVHGKWPKEFALTHEMASFAVSEGIPDPSAEFEDWLNYCCANAQPHADWHAAWRSWVYSLRSAAEMLARDTPYRAVARLLMEIRNLDYDYEAILVAENEALRREIKQIRRAIGSAYGQARSTELKR